MVLNRDSVLNEAHAAAEGERSLKLDFKMIKLNKDMCIDMCILSRPTSML